MRIRREVLWICMFRAIHLHAVIAPLFIWQFSVGTYICTSLPSIVL